MRQTLGTYAWWAMGRLQSTSVDPGCIRPTLDQRERFCRRVTLFASEAAKTARARLPDVDWEDAKAITASAASKHAAHLERFYDAMMAQWAAGDAFAGG